MLHSILVAYILDKPDALMILASASTVNTNFLSRLRDWFTKGKCMIPELCHTVCRLPICHECCQACRAWIHSSGSSALDILCCTRLGLSVTYCLEGHLLLATRDCLARAATIILDASHCLLKDSTRLSHASIVAPLSHACTMRTEWDARGILHALRLSRLRLRCQANDRYHKDQAGCQSQKHQSQA